MESHMLDKRPTRTEIRTYVDNMRAQNRFNMQLAQNIDQYLYGQHGGYWKQAYNQYVVGDIVHGVRLAWCGDYTCDFN